MSISSPLRRWARAMLLMVAPACSHLPPEPGRGRAEVLARPPVVLVHGIDDSARTMGPLAEHLEREGFSSVHAISLVPNDGSAPIDQLATQLAAFVEEVRTTTGAERVDLVGFSMGALVSRYYLQKLGGRDRVRRWVSISGPHGGTLMGYLRQNDGAKQMRPGSALLVNLSNEPDPFRGVDVFVFWSPLDLMIVPATSSRLPSARERSISVLLHPWMLRDGRVLRAVAEALRVKDPARFRKLPGLRPRSSRP